jgi:hypothetical protein
VTPMKCVTHITQKVRKNTKVPEICQLENETDDTLCDTT